MVGLSECAFGGATDRIGIVGSLLLFLYNVATYFVLLGELWFHIRCFS